ncbi:MAG: hypothetical protein IT245_02065 [Bacteroidia bacterium]|nr:hypothetical protein [Bacteroidia bacterium]
MKSNFFKLGLMSVVAFSALFTSCKPDEPVKTDEDEFVVLEGSLSTQVLDASKKYLIRGTATVEDGNTLTVPAGTKVFGEKKTKGTLLVRPGGKLVADGQENNPIIFTSNQAPGEREQGDWGGIVMLGKANVNQNSPAIEGISPAATYGTFNSTANDNDNSGVLRYVRIEYAGIALTPNNETNSLTMGGVGSGTTIDFVQTTYGGDDNYEWFGGTVNCKHLVSYAAWDDNFDVDFGFSGKVQFAVAVCDPFNADQSGSNGFEVDNDGSGTTATPKTSAVFSNITILGPVFDSAKASISGNYQHALHLRRNSEISIFNSVIGGFPLGLNLDGTLNNYTSDLGVLENNILFCSAVKGKTTRPFFNGSSSSTAVADYFKVTKNNVAYTASTPTSGTPAYSKAIADAGVNPELILGYKYTAGVSGNYPANPDFATFTGASQTGAAFTNSKVSSWFTSTTYRGAFGSTDWTDNWANFNPQNIAY